MKKLGFYSFNKKLNININDYYLYYLNPNFFNEINNKKIFIFVGYNLRLESPILNIKLRKKKIKEEILYFIIGSNFNDNLNCIHLGLNLKNLIMYLQGKLKVCDLVLKRIKKNQTNFNYLQNFFSFNMFLLGNNLINRIDNKNIFNLVYKYINNINLFDLKSNINKKYISGFFFNYCKNVLNFFNNKNLIHSNINILYINLTSILFEEFNNLNSIHNIKKISKNDIFYLLGIDFFKYQKAKFLIFQGHHLNLEYLNVNLIFPSITFFEKSSDFLNIEGSFIQTNFVLYPPVFCRND
jgi:NADH-quinone oxidoreductase subunit G